MFKKTMLLAMAVGALAAFAAPTVASAQLLTDPAGTALAKGAQFSATSTNLVTTTGLGNLTCAKVTIHLEVLVNKATTSEAKSTGVTTEECHLVTKVDGVTHVVTITSASANFHLEPNGVGTANATFVADLYAQGDKGEQPFAVCHFASTTPALALTYTTNTDSVHVAGGLVGVSPCPTTGTIHGDFTLETIVGGTTTPITID